MTWTCPPRVKVLSLFRPPCRPRGDNLDDATRIGDAAGCSRYFVGTIAEIHFCETSCGCCVGTLHQKRKRDQVVGCIATEAPNHHLRLSLSVRTESPQKHSTNMENAMTRALILGATALALSAGAASAQAVYVTPSYGYAAPAYVAPAPVYVAPPPVYAAPPVVSHYYAAPVTVAPPVYDYAPGYTTVITAPGW